MSEVADMEHIGAQSDAETDIEADHDGAELEDDDPEEDDPRSDSSTELPTGVN